MFVVIFVQQIVQSFLSIFIMGDVLVSICGGGISMFDSVEVIGGVDVVVVNGGIVMIDFRVKFNNNNVY